MRPVIHHHLPLLHCFSFYCCPNIRTASFTPEPWNSSFMIGLPRALNFGMKVNSVTIYDKIFHTQFQNIFLYFASRKRTFCNVIVIVLRTLWWLRRSLKATSYKSERVVPRNGKGMWRWDRIVTQRFRGQCWFSLWLWSFCFIGSGTKWNPRFCWLLDFKNFYIL